MKAKLSLESRGSQKTTPWNSPLPSLRVWGGRMSPLSVWGGHFWEWSNEAPTKQLHLIFVRAKMLFVSKCFSTSSVNFTTESYKIHGIGSAVSTWHMGRLSSFQMAAGKRPVQSQDQAEGCRPSGPLSLSLSLSMGSCAQGRSWLLHTEN